MCAVPIVLALLVAGAARGAPTYVPWPTIHACCGGGDPPFAVSVAAAGRTGVAIVGARLAGNPDTGAVHVLALDAGALRASFADGAPEADLGWSVATEGGTVVVGAAGE